MIDRPRFIDAYAEMALAPRTSGKTGAEGDPKLVVDHKLSAEDANTHLRIAGRSIAVMCGNCFGAAVRWGSALATVLYGECR